MVSAKRDRIHVLTEAMTYSGQPGSNCHVNINLAEPWTQAHSSSHGWMAGMPGAKPSVGLSFPPFTCRSRGLD